MKPRRQHERSTTTIGDRTSLRRWADKFRVAGRGVVLSVRDQSSFWVHLFVTVCVIATAAWLRVDWTSLSILVAMIGLVWTAEMLNTSIEQLVAVLHPRRDDRVGSALDVAAGGVLVAAIAAVAVGLMILGPPLWQWLWSR